MQCLSGYRHTLFLLLFVSYGVYLFMLHEPWWSAIHRFIIHSICLSLPQCHWPWSLPLNGECTCFFLLCIWSADLIASVSSIVVRSPYWRMYVFLLCVCSADFMPSVLIWNSSPFGTQVALVCFRECVGVPSLNWVLLCVAYLPAVAIPLFWFARPMQYSLPHVSMRCVWSCISFLSFSDLHHEFLSVPCTCWLPSKFIFDIVKRWSRTSMSAHSLRFLLCRLLVFAV